MKARDGMNILLVDDEILAIEAICAKAPFEKYGITEVLTANSMHQAVELLQKKPVDMILCDIEMPNGSGLELLEWINQQYPDMVKMILSCHNEFEFARQAVELSCCQYLLKPATGEVLDKALAKAAGQVMDRLTDSRLKKLGEEYAHKFTDTEEGEADIAETVKDYIVKNIQEELVVEELARMVHVSQNHLGRCFKKKYGKTILEYIGDCRLALAEKLLRDTRLTVTSISAKVGYSNYAYFIKQFKKYSGYTPSQFRNLFGQK